MKVVSKSPWTYQNQNLPSQTGLSSLETFASTLVPQIDSLPEISSLSGITSALQSSNRVRRVDLCPRIGSDQTGELTIVPFSEVSKYVNAGDVVTFVSDNEFWQSNDYTTILKQRGWHAEMIMPDRGTLVMRGAWDYLGDGARGKVSNTPLNNLKGHPRYPSLASIWNLHIFRFAPPNSSIGTRFSDLMRGLEGWSSVIPRTEWPGDMAFNPILFTSASDLLNLGDQLIQYPTQMPKMFCIEWVNAMLCLACCYPLTRKFLSLRSTFDAFQRNFAGVPLLQDTLEPFDTVPWKSYSEEYIVDSFFETYFNQTPAPQLVEELLNEAKLPRQRVIMPIVPLLEARKKSDPSNFDVTYVCTAVDDAYCVRQ